MKFSQFNTSLLYKGNFILYNAMSDSFLLINQFLSTLFEAAVNEKSPQELRQCHLGFYEELENKGFIVPTEKDEIEAVKTVQKIIDGSVEQYHLVINPTMNCNFGCWYCYESHIKDSKVDPNTLSKIKQHIFSTLSKDKKIKQFQISWFGGEPLLYYKQVIKPLLEYSYQLCNELSINFLTAITTNGFLIRSDMVDTFQKHNFIDFQITLDGHRDIHDTIRFVNSKRGSYDQIIKNIILLCESSLHVTLRINYTKKTLATIESIVDDIKNIIPDHRKYLTISFHKVWQEEMTADLDASVQEKIGFFILNGFKTISGGNPDGVRKSCYADRANHATINYNGDVFKCTARKFSPEDREGVLNNDGTIAWNERYVNRLQIKFKNKPCLSCPILPICNGGCSQHAIENQGKDYCVFDFDEDAKKKVVLNKFLEKMPAFRV